MPTPNRPLLIPGDWFISDMEWIFPREGRVTRGGKKKPCLHSILFPSIGWTVLQYWRQAEKKGTVTVISAPKYWYCLAVRFKTAILLWCWFALCHLNRSHQTFEAQVRSPLWRVPPAASVCSILKSTAVLVTCSSNVSHKGFLKAWGPLKKGVFSLPHQKKTTKY